MSDPKEHWSHDDDAGEIGSKGVPAQDLRGEGQRTEEDQSDGEEEADEARREVEAGGAG